MTETASHKESVRRYFAAKAAEYDATDLQPYWRLSDALLWWLLRPYVEALQPGFTLLDAGGGTGRWTDRIMRFREDGRATLFDMSSEMVEVAVEKARLRGYADRLTTVIDDLATLDDSASGSPFDLVTCFHNVIGFVPDPADTLRRIHDVLRPGAALALVTPSLYHLAYFNIANGDVDEAARAVASGRGRFVSDMPEIQLFRPRELQALLEDLGFDVERMTGFPCLIYPEFAETRLRGTTGWIATLLDDADTFQTIYELEQAVVQSSDIAARGNNIFCLARARPASGAGSSRARASG